MICSCSWDPLPVVASGAVHRAGVGFRAAVAVVRGAGVAVPVEGDGAPVAAAVAVGVPGGSRVAVGVTTMAVGMSAVGMSVRVVAVS